MRSFERTYELETLKWCLSMDTGMKPPSYGGMNEGHGQVWFARELTFFWTYSWPAATAL